MKPKPFTASDMPISGGRVYHLDLAPEELAKDILIVGVPVRVTAIANDFFKTRETERFHRGLRTITGITKENGHRVTVVTSGMGTPSLEIVLNELYILNEIDLKTRLPKKHSSSASNAIHIIRVGTSGGLQAETALGTSVITEYAVGLDNTGLFYDVRPSGKCKELEEKVRMAITDMIPKSSPFKFKIHPYAVQANVRVSTALQHAAGSLNVPYKMGITASCSGFFANQGRNISRIPLTVPDIDSVLAKMGYAIDGLRFENMEMESSFLLQFMGGLGYWAGSICPTIANRRLDTFDMHYAKSIRDATDAALKALHFCRREPPESI
ncbi:nucleoside phosphorylase [Candidatus Woesearchaeota archaeon]|nr:nucleoside phosphorylase [Candidatus Woesearchaeota archaeon]